MEHTLQEDLIGKYLSGEMDAREEGELMAWVNASAQNRTVFEESVQLWSLSEGLDEEPEFPVDLPLAWAALDKRIDLGESTISANEPILRPLNQPIFRKLNWAWSAAAAVAVLVLAAWWVFLKDSTPQVFAYTSGDNQRQTITLPDQSSIVLNENSTLTYRFDKKTRQVELSGEAFFDVQKDPKHPFVIKSGDIETKVVGTSFIVRAYPDEEQIKVSVKTGRVEVRKFEKVQQKEASPIVLLPGNSAIYATEAATLEKAQDIAVEDVDSWNKGIIVFPDGSKVGEVIPAVEKLYNIKIEVKDKSILDEPTTRVAFNPQRSVQEAMGLLTFPIPNGAFKQEGDTYIIFREEK